MWDGAALGRIGQPGARRGLATEQGRPPAQSEQPVYAHEDLLLPSSVGRTPPRSRRGSVGSSSSTPSSRHSRSTQPFFSPSYLLAEEPPLPPPSTSPLVPLSTPIPLALPPSVLSSGLPNPLIRWRARLQTSIKDDIDLYKALGKFKLSSLVVLTTMAGYAMCPLDPSTTSAAMDAFAQTLPLGIDPAALSSASSALSNNLTLSILLPTTVGTTLCAFSAASFNQLIEAPYDAQMARTRNRPLPKRAVTPLHAASYGALTGTVGLATLYAINPLAAALGAFTIALYCPLYTIAKRHTPYNTWLGSVVGAIPPLIGWAACTSSVDPISQPGAWALFGLMFFWQFPHFMSLAHTLRSSYASSGYRMLAVLNPPHNALVSLRYSLALIPLCAAFPWLGLTNLAFAPLSLVPNGLLAVAAWRFWRKREERRAKELFWASLVQLPLILGLAMACKKGLWGKGVGDEDEEKEVVMEKVVEEQQ
jgi:protoheme IX farnesyltransferase